MMKQEYLQKYPLPAKPPKKQTLVDLADAAVDIREIMRDMGLWAPFGDFYSYKIYCPWHEEHSDQLDKNCRIFGSTNIYCWAMHGYITPTVLYAKWKHIPRIKAAEKLLDARGLLKKNWRETWNDLMDAREEPHAILGNKQDAIAALHMTLADVPGYYEQEFSSEVRQQWTAVLSALDAIWEKPGAGFDELSMWLDESLTNLTHSVMIASRGNI